MVIGPVRLELYVSTHRAFTPPLGYTHVMFGSFHHDQPFSWQRRRVPPTLLDKAQS